jgi:hypothetical protein
MLSRTAFVAKVDLHNKILKQVCPALEESTPTVQLFKERNSTKTVLFFAWLMKAFEFLT